MGSLNCTVFFSTLQSFFLPFRAVENVPESAPSAMREPCSLDSVDAHFFFPAGGSPLANGRRVSVVDCCWTPKEPEAPRETKQDALDPQSNHHRGRLSLSKDPVPMEGSGRIHRASPAPSCSPARLNQAGPWAAPLPSKSALLGFVPERSLAARSPEKNGRKGARFPWLLAPWVSCPLRHRCHTRARPSGWREGRSGSTAAAEPAAWSAWAVAVHPWASINARSDQSLERVERRRG